MALSDVTREGVELAMVEFDRLGRDVFLSQFGFRKARGYFLVHGGRRYDSKAVVGVAHGYDRPDLGPLQPKDFSGGDATVARRLDDLGFEVDRLRGNPRWVEEELILALDLYLREGMLNKTHPSVVELSERLNSLTVHAERSDLANFRNPAGVAMKLANFAWIDPSHRGGLKHGGALDREVWNRYASEQDALVAAAAAIRGEGRLPAVPTDEPPDVDVAVVEVEAQHVERFRVSVPGQDRMATRRELRLVQAFRKHLEEQGRRVIGHEYRLPGSKQPLSCDLMDESDNMLYEAKGDVLRTSVRMAIGQLLDYRRFEETSPRLAILLPREPAQDLINLIHTVPASAVWQTDDGFTSQPPSESNYRGLGM